MLPGMEMLACPNLAVSPEIMQHVVHVESGANPYAIGVVGGQLERQPRNLAEALATAQMLDARGYNFSVGLAQVNRVNLDRYGLDSYRKAFGTCANLAAGARILADCYTSAHGDWPKAFSCYYSGNFTTGFRDGYVQKVYASINRQAGNPMQPARVSQPPSATVAWRSSAVTPTAGRVLASHLDLKPVTVHASRSEDYRVALRSMAIDTAAQATVAAIAAANGKNASAVRQTAATKPPATANASADDARTLAVVRPPRDSVFVPEVHGPGDPPQIAAPTDAVTATGLAELVPAGTDNAVPQQEQGDAAFVF
jgi:type IV secretion system protein VirB1